MKRRCLLLTSLSGPLLPSSGPLLPSFGGWQKSDEQNLVGWRLAGGQRPRAPRACDASSRRSRTAQWRRGVFSAAWWDARGARNAPLPATERAPHERGCCQPFSPRRAEAAAARAGAVRACARRARVLAALDKLRGARGGRGGRRRARGRQQTYEAQGARRHQPLHWEARLRGELSAIDGQRGHVREYGTRGPLLGA